MTAATNRPVLFEINLPKEHSPYFQQLGSSKEPDLTKRIAHGGRMEVPWVDTISEKDEKTGKMVNRMIRFIARATSIYVDEQILEGFPRDYGLKSTSMQRNVSQDFIYISNGTIEADPITQQNLVEYLKKADYNGSKEGRNKSKMLIYYFTDLQFKAKKLLDENKDKNKAHYLIDQLLGDTRKQNDLARVFSIDTNLSEEELLMQLHARADISPDLIINAMQGDTVNAQIVASQAVEFGIVVYEKYAYLYPTGDRIKGFKIGTDPDVAFKGFVKFLQSDEGQSHYQNLQKQIEARAESEAKELSV